jgi:hypothetical protein
MQLTEIATLEAFTLEKRMGSGQSVAEAGVMPVSFARRYVYVYKWQI